MGLNIMFDIVLNSVNFGAFLMNFRYACAYDIDDLFLSSDAVWPSVCSIPNVVSSFNCLKVLLTRECHGLVTRESYAGMNMMFMHTSSNCCSILRAKQMGMSW